MGIVDLFSKRKKRLNTQTTDVFTYDRIPEKLRVQVVHILSDTIGNEINGYETNQLAQKLLAKIKNILVREYGRFNLYDSSGSLQEELYNFFLRLADSDEALDFIETAFHEVDTTIRNTAHYQYLSKATMSPDEAISDLNRRFVENSVGYQFAAGELIRMDSTFTHSEVTLPTIQLLSRPKFHGANLEYLRGHEHYRHGRNSECLVECLKAFESTMKIICQEKGWPFNPNKDTSSKLIAICLSNNLIPSSYQSQFTSLKSLLNDGIPTVRNRTSGHGQGAVPRTVNDDITRYGLNLTGSNIIFLVELSGIN